MAAMRRPGSVAKILVAGTSLLLVGACSAAPDEDAPPPPKALSAQEYASTLKKSLGPLDASLKRLGAATTYKGLESRVGEVETSAQRAADQLAPIVPPAELADAHTQLVGALQGLETELGDVGQQVNDHALCTGSSVRAGLGSAKQTAAVRTALAAVSAGLTDGSADIPALALPADNQKDGTRPSNGKYIKSRDLDGQGQLTIDNGSSRDAVVTITKGSKPAVSVYVRKGKEYTVKRVPDGTYQVYFTGGAGWDGKARAFGRDCAFQRFDQTMGFKTTRTSSQVLYQTYRITLQPVVGGNARTNQVDPDEFPDS